MDPEARRAIVRDALGIGIATGAYGLSFGAVSTTAGLNVAQTCALSLLMFTGGSQFALVGVVGGGGAAFAGAASAMLLGIRNGFYGLRLTTVLPRRWAARAASSHWVIDESAAMAVAHPDDVAKARLAFYATGGAVFVLWNLATLVGALGANAVSDPSAYGLDAAAPAAFLALLVPQVRNGTGWRIPLVAAVGAIVAAPFVPVGVPILLAAAIVVVLTSVQRTPSP